MSEDDKSVTRWAMIASAIGYNQLCIDHAKTMGEKIYFRLFRDHSIEKLIELGGQSPFEDSQDDPTILEIETPDGLPFMKFRESDIQRMKECVESYEGRKK